MADLKRTFTIEIAGVKESVTNLESLEGILSKMEKQVETINKNGGFSVVSKEMNKNTREAIDLAKAEEIAQGNVVSSYREKQKALTALGKEIKTMTAADDESTKKQQELIGQYNQLNGQLKEFDAAMGNHQRNVGDYRGALKETTQQIKEMQGEMAQMLMNGVDKADPKFKALAQKAGELKDAIDDARQEVGRFASDTKKLDDVINVAQSATAAFTLYKGAMNAFGVETKGAEEAIQELAGAMSIIQSLQTLQNTLKEGSATAQLFQLAMKASGAELVVNQVNAIKAAAAQEGLSKAQKIGAVTSKALGLAMKAIPLMLVISLVTTLILHWEDLVGWFNKTFPALKKVGGAMNGLKSIAVGLGKAILNWIVNPFKTLANVVSKLFSGDFEGALKAAQEGIKNQFKGTVDAFKTGFQSQVEKGLDEMADKALENTNKVTKQELEELKIRERNNKTYSKKYIDLQKKDFAERKKLAKGNKDELNKIKLEEMQFFADVEDKKTAAAKQGAANRVKASKDAAKNAAKDAADAAKAEEERQKKIKEFFQEWVKNEYARDNAELTEDIRILNLELEKYVDGPLDKYLGILKQLKYKQKDIANLEYIQKLEELWNSMSKEAQNAFENFDRFKDLMEKGGYRPAVLSEEVGAEMDKVSSAWKLLKTNTDNTVREINDNINAKTVEALRKNVSTVTKDIDNAYKDLIEKVSGNLEPVRDKIFGFIDKDKTLKKFEEARAEWQKTYDEVRKLIADAETAWDEYISLMLVHYGEDSQKYKDAVREKEEALKKFYKTQEELEKRATPPTSLTNDYNADNKKDTPEPKKKLWHGKGDKKSDGSEYTLIDNIANLFQSIDEMVLAPAMDTFQMYMDFAIEETQKKLEIVQEMHDDALDKVEESTEKIKELNDSLKDSNNTNLEATKQQLADEQILYAQRLSEEKKLAEQEKDLKNKANEQEYQSRMMELRYQLIMSIANTAQGVARTLAEWPYPISLVFAGLQGVLGAVQTAIIAKQLSSMPKPRKLADGGLIEGPSHATGGVPVGNTGIEVEGGEAIINKRSTKKYKTLLDAINASGNGGKHTIANTDKRIRKFANGGQLNFEAADANLRQNAGTNRVIDAIEGINFQPVVSVVDFEKVQSRLTKVRSLAGR